MKQPLRLCLLSLFVASSLSACGSSDSDDQADTPPPTAEQPTNQSPEANHVSVELDMNTSITIEVLANDSDPDGDALSLTSITDAEHGVAEIDGNAVKYTPNQDFSGEDSFTYVVTDGELEDTARVSITVNPVNRAPTANDMASSFSGNDTQLIDVLANDMDPDGDELELVSISSAEYGVTSIEHNQVSYTPEPDFVGVDTFSYVMTDGEYEAQAEVTVTMSQSVSLVGRIIDAPIANATVVIEIEDQRFTVVADGEGRYELPFEIFNRDSDEVLRMRARGSELHGQSFVTLSSRLLTVGQLLDLAGAGGELTRSELNQVQVTQITTARDVLLTRAAGEQAVTADNIQQLDSSIDPELIMEMAAVIKLLVDDENYTLPDGVETLEDFLEEANAYNETLHKANQSGDLARAIEETLSDPEVMPELNQLLGQYVQITDTPYFMTNRSFRNYEFRDDGTMIYAGGVKEVHGERGRFLNRIYNWYQDGNENHFESIDGNANFELSVEYTPYTLMNEEQRAALVAEYGDFAKDWSYHTIRYDFVDSFRVLSLTDKDAVVRVRHRSEYPAIVEWDAEGEQYEMIPRLHQYFESTIRLANVDDLKLANGRFENVTGSPIILPDLYGYTTMRNMYNLRPDGTAEIAVNDYYYHGGSNYYVADGRWTAHWSLHDNDQMLRITLRDENGDVVNHIDNYKHRDQGAAIGLLSTFHNDRGEYFISLGEAGQVPEVEFSTDALLAQLDNTNMMVSAVNRSLPDWNGYQLKPSDWFGWSLHANGTGQRPALLCDGRYILGYEICEGEFTYDDWPYEDLEWQVQDQWLLIDRTFDLVEDGYCNPEYYAAYENGAPCNRRVIMPLRQTDRGIVLGIEYNLSNTYRSNIFYESQPYYLVEPRFMVWTIQDLPTVHEWDIDSLQMHPAHLTNPLDAYNRVNNTRDLLETKQ